MKYYFRLFKRVSSISTSNMLMYRSNILFFFVFESLFMVSNLVGLSMGVSFAGGQLAGWNYEQVIFVAMLFQVGHQIFTTFALGGLFHIGWYVWSGRMDFVLLKPLHPLIAMHAVNEFIISNLPNVFINLSLFFWSIFRLHQSGQSFTIQGSLGLFVFFTVGMAVRYGIALVVVTPSFFAEKLAEGEDAYWSVQSLAKYPTGVFPHLMQNFFNFILPIATIAAVPASVFFGRESLSSAVTYLICSIIFVILALKFFRFGVTKYQSVNTGT